MDKNSIWNLKLKIWASNLSSKELASICIIWGSWKVKNTKLWQIFRNSIFSRQSFLRTTKSSRWKKIPQLIGEERNWWHILTRERRWRKRNERRVQSYHHPLKPSNPSNSQNFLCIKFHGACNNNRYRWEVRL